MDKKLYIGCDCGCGEGIVFRAHRGSVYAEFSSFGFYREQGRFLSALRKDIDALKGNPLTSFMVAEDDLKAVFSYIQLIMPVFQTAQTRYSCGETLSRIRIVYRKKRC